MTQDDLLVKASNGVLHTRVALDAHTLVTCGLDEEDIIRLRSELKHHRCVIELRACVGSDNLTATCVAAEEKDVESVSLLDELCL